MNPSSSDDGSLQSLIRLIRRVCLLTEQGDESEAVRLERTQLAEAVRQYRHDHGPDALTEQHLAEIFMAEQRRAADAVVLAELLIPQLTGRARAEPRSAPARPADETAASPAASAEAASSRAPVDIPDFLDAMLSGESGKRRVRFFPQSTTTQ